MPDRKKVIKGLEACTRPGTKGCFHDLNECPYEWHGCRSQMEADALALLKEQDAVKPPIDAFGHPYCPKCKILVYETWKFCPHCGQEVIWE